MIRLLLTGISRALFQLAVLMVFTAIVLGYGAWRIARLIAWRYPQPARLEPLIALMFMAAQYAREREQRSAQPTEEVAP